MAGQENLEIYDNDEQEIDLSALMFSVLRKYGLIIKAAVACAVLGLLFGLFSAWRTEQAAKEAEANGEQVKRSSAEQQYEEDMVEYRQSKKTHDTNIKNYKSQLLSNERSQTNTQYNITNAEEYIEKSVRNSIDPYNVHKARADYYVTTDYKILPGMDYQTPDYTGTVLSTYQSLVTNSETMSAIAAQFDMEERYLRELVSVSYDGSTRMVHVSVIAASDEDASAILDAIMAKIDELYDTVATNVGNHEIVLLSRSTSTTVDTSLRDEQQSTDDNLVSLQNSLANLKTEHDLIEQNIETADADFEALEVPEEPTGNGLLKYAVIGCAIGIVLAVAVVAVQFIVDGKVYSAQSVKSTCRLPVLGTLAGKRGKHGRLGKFDAWLDKMQHRPDYKTNGETMRLIAASIHNLAPEAKSVMITGDLELGLLSALAASLQKSSALQDQNVFAAESVLKSSSTVVKITEADAIVLVADCACSTFNNIKAQNEQIIGFGKSVLGCVVLD